VDEIVPQFKELWRVLGIQYDHFIRTTDDYHKKVVQKVLSGSREEGRYLQGKVSGVVLHALRIVLDRASAQRRQMPGLRPRRGPARRGKLFFQAFQVSGLAEGLYSVKIPISFSRNIERMKCSDF
jgi:hypothetical protein